MKLRITLASGLLLAAGSLGGCASTEHFVGLVKERAAYDLQCDPQTLTVTELPGMAYGVRGCDRQASYVVTGASCQNPKQLTKREVGIYCTPVLDHSVAPPASASPDATTREPEPEPEPEPETQTDPEPLQESEPAAEPESPSDAPMRRPASSDEEESENAEAGQDTSDATE